MLFRIARRDSRRITDANIRNFFYTDAQNDKVHCKFTINQVIVSVVSKSCSA